MKRIGLRFPMWARVGFSASFLLSFTTGLLWFYLDRWGEIDGEFGPEKHPLLGPLSKAHGAGAFIALISFGMILSAHIPVGWRAGWSRRSGIMSLLSVCTSVVTAWGLYYAGSDTWRSAITWVHLGAGLSLPVLIVIHIGGNRRHRKRNS